MLVDELSGSHLDYWVAQVEQRNTDIAMQGSAQRVPRFSMDPALAQPIIERERIVVGMIHDAELGVQAVACVGSITPGGVRSEDGRYWLGDSELQAAMRCYVGINYGAIVV
ncbi:phage protein NinX family protein [Paraburkholderia terricola]|uniref:Uncharacterized protein n=1 Tax=Paraburkholderia terricola TaxID=169427 RepID=A0A1M6Q9R4_9BURK|nr:MULTISPECIES: phage protein NinX family protein [Paraburkholderia]SDO11649.1 Protein of unknown function [Paraburkholderia sediminicola]SHK17019.1 Protein of unknown function [Paraburkholderia terricola]